MRAEQSKRPQRAPAANELRRAYSEARALVSSLERATTEVRDLVRDQLQCRPYVTLGIASGFGYVFGGGPPSRLAGLLLGFGGRLGLELFVRDLIRHEERSAR